MLLALLACDNAAPDDTGKVVGGGDTDTDSAETGDSDTANADMVLTLQLGATDADHDEDVDIVARVTAGGEPTDEVVELSVNAPAVIDDGEVSSPVDGIFTVTATWQDQTQTASFTVDENGPLLAVTGPTPASWLPVGEVSVNGTWTDGWHGLDSVAVDESTATASSSTWAGAAGLTDGLNVSTVSAVDDDPYPKGNASDIMFGVLAGVTAPLADSLRESMEVYATDEALDALGSQLGDAFDASAIEAALIASNPVLETTVGCLDITATALSLTFDEPVVHLSPDPPGLMLELEIPNLDVEMRIDGDVCGIGSISDTGHITASSVTAQATYDLEVPTPGDVVATVRYQEVAVNDADIDFPGLEATLASFGTSVEALGIDPATLLEDQLGTLLESEVPALLEATFEAIQVDQTFEAVGAELTLKAILSDIVVDVGGMLLRLDSNVSSSTTWSELPPNPGSLTLVGDPPDYTAIGDDLALSLSLDALNRLMHLAWSAGAFTQQVDGVDDSTVIALLGAYFPGVTSVSIGLTPLLPPVVVPGDEASPLWFQLGEMQLDLVGDIDGASVPLGTGKLFVQGDLAVGLADGALDLSVENPDLTVDLTPDGPDDVGQSEELEALFTAGAGSLVGGLLPSIHFELPSLGDIALTPSGVATAGSAGTWVEIEGALGP